MSAKALRDAAAILLAQADIMDGKPSSTYYGERLGPILETWNKLIAQYGAEDAARVDIAKCYETHKNLWKAAEREGWKMPDGNRFWSGNYKNARDFTNAVRYLWSDSMDGMKWRIDPLNAPLLPKGEPQE